MPEKGWFSKAISNGRVQVQTKAQAFFKSLPQPVAKAFRYIVANRRWVYAVGFIGAGIYAGSWLEEKNAFLDLRYGVHQFTQQLGSKLRGDLYDHNTVVVLIEDDIYWKDSYEGRRPINQQNLAELITKLNEYNPRVIALDFDLRSPMPDGSVIQYPRYAEETGKLADAVKAITTSNNGRTKVVLPKTLGYDGPSWIMESDTYDGRDLGTPHFGYIVLNDDYRIIPASVKLKDGSRFYSFSQAIVRAFDITGKALRFDQEDGSPTYAGPYLEEDDFIQYSAGNVLDPTSSIQAELPDKLSGKIVIVGGAWNRYAYGRGPRIDERTTPADTAPAVFLHANWVESILQQRAAKPVAHWIAIALEVVVGFFGYAVFTYRMRWYWKAIYLVSLAAFWLIVAYVSAQNLGLFFDPLTPTLVGVGKAAYEEIHEWYKDAKKYREQHESSKFVAKKEVANAA